MRVGFGALCKGSMVAGCLFLALLPALAQNASRKAAGAPASARALMLEKGHALEARGRPDLAIQVWQQVLLSDPNNAEALAGLARDLKLTGSDKAIDALDHLRKVSPNNPEIAKIQGLASTRAENTELRQAGELARQGKREDAMRIYRQLYGDRPPDGDIALAYYQTLYGTASGKLEAVTAMRALTARNPGDPRFSVELGKMLTYDQKTRGEGMRILREHPKDLNAQAALRQALVWEAANPASAPELRTYVKEHPQDTELAGHLKQNQAKLAQMNSGIARTPAERAAFAALNAKHLDDAEKRFTAILEAEPNNGRADAGMGFLRMQQRNFADAVTYLAQAETNGYKDRSVEDGLATSRFWYTMSQASLAVEQSQFETASARYREALAQRPTSPEALNGLGGLLLRQQQFAAAAAIYEQLLKAQPDSTDGWRGLFLSCANDGQNQKAFDLEARIPAPVKATLARDPEYLRTLATLYQAANRPADAERVLNQAMALPFPGNGASLKPDIKLEYAAILMMAKHYSQAIGLYSQLLAADPNNLSAWLGLVGAHHEMGQDDPALDDVKRMPPSAYEAAIADPGFLTMLAAIYQQANQLEVAQGLLERAVKLQSASGGQPAVALQLQLAGICLQRNDTAKAYDLYRQVLQNNPASALAWKGLISALSATNRNAEALQQMVLIPSAVRKGLETDIEFVQTEAGVYASTGDAARATEFMDRVLAYYAKLRTEPPAPIEIQNAWLLFNTGNDRALYPALMRLGSQAGLTVAQRETVQDIWANWSVRRAAAAMDNGNVQRSVDILDAALQAFPANLTVRKAVAGGYVQVGRARESLALYKTISMEDATASDFQGAIGAALAANDRNQAELWLRQALERFQRDAAILSLAARYEQARGDNRRAADYYRASLAAMPAASPAQKLAHVLVYPDQDTKVRRAVTAADLQQLLDPNADPFPKTTKLPPLPAYGSDPYNGSAPVVLTPGSPRAQQPPLQQTPAQQDSTWTSPPAGQRQPAAPIYVPQSYALHRTQLERFSNTRALSGDVRGGLFLRKGHFNAVLPVYSNWRTAVAARPRTGPRLVYATFSIHLRNRAALEQETPPAEAWKRLIASLVASNHSADALKVLPAIPPGVRRQLETDADFDKTEADLYLSAGDVAHAAESLNRAEQFYQARHAAVPVAVELQRAFLLDNLQDDHSLRPLLQGLNARPGLTPSQRRQLADLTARSAARQSGAQAQAVVQPNPPSSRSPYEGRMKLPPSEETVDTTDTVSASAVPPSAPQPPVWTPRPSSGAPNPAPPLRITAQPMGTAAAQAQALFADQTDSQLTQGSAIAIHRVSNTSLAPPPSLPPASEGSAQFKAAQYTPSAQEAATGAYSAPRQQAQQPAAPPAVNPNPQAATPPAKPAAARRPAAKKSASAGKPAASKKRAAAQSRSASNSTPTLGQAPVQGTDTAEPAHSPEQLPPPADAQAPASAPAPSTDTGLTDEELQQRNLPPLRGPWIRIQRQPNPVSPRDEAEMQLHAIESGYSPWLGGAGVVNYRSGSLGYDHLTALEAPFEVSMPLGYNSRVTIVAKPVFLDSGQADGNSVISVQESTTSGAALVSIPQPIGTLTETATNVPAQQNAFGIGGEVQLAFPHAALAAGYTPAGFLVATVTGRASFKPGNGPFTFNFSRDPVRDTQLSYAGLRDPSGNTLGNLGQIWGGVVANQGQVQFAHGDEQSGYYVGVGGQYLSGYHVQTNTRIDGDGGAYWRIKTLPEFGNLSIGANFFGMHYAHNEDAFTHGMGGYFSPQSYFLANVPFTWTAHYGTRWHYNVLGSFGVQAFQEDMAPLWPLAVDKALETAMSNAMLPAKTSVGPNYDLRSQVSYQIGPHWFAGGFLGANNSRNYSSVNAGFSIHYMFRSQPSTVTTPTGIFPTEGLRPFSVP